MLEFVVNNYLVWKCLHIIALISWMAGMLYLPRLFVYHTSAKPNGELDRTLKIMENKLLRYIMNPAMIATYLFGILLAIAIGKEALGPWFHVKLFLVLLLTLAHAMMARYRKKFALGYNKKSAKFFRIFNEVPAILMVIIVFTVVMKPF